MTIPTHIAIIMDGNRRWARERRLPVFEGHRRVANGVIEKLVERAAERGVQYLTFWAWSTENWRRSKEEIEGILMIFRHSLKKRWQRLHEKGVRIKIIGDIQPFPDDIKYALKEIEEETKQNTAITVLFGLNYGGRDEIIRAINAAISYQLSAISNIEEDIIKGFQIDADTLSRCLDTAGIPDPDLIIRTGGEQRLSGFLLWQSEYSELYFPKWYMPEFTPDRLDEALEEFRKRKRNFGV